MDNIKELLFNVGIFKKKDPKVSAKEEKKKDDEKQPC